MPYVALADRKAQECFDDGPSQLEQRLDYIEGNLGIDIDDPSARDKEINGKWKAKAILGELKKPLQVSRSDWDTSLSTLKKRTHPTATGTLPPSKSEKWFSRELPNIVIPGLLGHFAPA